MELCAPATLRDELIERAHIGTLPAGTAPRLAGRGLVTLYRYTLSPLIGPRCRHLPTCSDYADQAIGRFGLWAGGWMALARILRCHPWGTHGLDFVPADRCRQTRTGALPWRYGRWRGTQQSTRTAGQEPGGTLRCRAPMLWRRTIQDLCDPS